MFIWSSVVLILVIYTLFTYKNIIIGQPLFHIDFSLNKAHKGG